jgi:DNA-binding HxlR family transcriptional regulator
VTGYGQFCPMAKATEIIGEKWCLLIVRELLMGAVRFSEIQRSLSKISPTILTKRLKQLEAAGIVTRKRPSGNRTSEYRLTPAGKELSSVLEQTAIWGMRWARGQMADEDLDVYHLMSEIRRRVQTDELPDGETVLSFSFSDLSTYATWWVVIDRGDVDLCSDNPGKDVDLYIATDIRTMVEVWMGDLSLAKCLEAERMNVIGDADLARRMGDWLGLSMFSEVPRPSRLPL